MNPDLNAKTILVTGASAGIGLACAKIALAAGARVVMASRDRDRLEARSSELASKDVSYHVADLSLPDEREALFHAHPDIDVLINNAGAIPGGTLASLSMDQWRSGWELKVFGYIHLTKLYCDRMRQRGSGCVVNIIGIAGRAPKADYICGSAGNAALIAFTEALGSETPRDGVRVCGINPGMTATARAKTLVAQRRNAAPDSLDDENSGATLDLPFGRMATPEEIGATAAFLASDAAAYISGTVIDIDGGRRFWN